MANQINQHIGEGEAKAVFAFSVSAKRGPDGHRGLWADKFGIGWSARKGQLELKSTVWATENSGAAGNADCLRRYNARIRDVVAFHARQFGVEAERLMLPAVQAGRCRFVTGLGIRNAVENGFAWHPSLGVPYLPGSGIKGATLAWARDWQQVGGDDLDRIFGRGPEERQGAVAGSPGSGAMAGSVVFLDALPVSPPRITAEVLTPHGAGSGAPDDAGSPIPNGFLAVTEMQLVFAVIPNFRHAMKPPIRRDDEETGDPGDRHAQAIGDCERALGWLGDAARHAGFGAKTKAGFGRFQPSPNAGPAAET